MSKVDSLKALGLKVTGQAVGGDSVCEVLSDFKNKYVVPDGGMIPTGGTTGQVLKKASGTNYDVAWGADVGFDPTTVAGYDATKSQTLTHVSGTLTWVDIESE